MNRSEKYYQNARQLLQEHKKCALCGYSTNLEVHHIIPVVLAQDYRQCDDIENLIVVCKGCHAKLTPTKLLTSIALQRKQKQGCSQIGQTKGAKLTTKKSVRSKEIIKKQSRDFDGDLSDVELIRVTGLARGTFYKYKREIRKAREIT